jgi:hypothetical protein
MATTINQASAIRQSYQLVTVFSLYAYGVTVRPRLS